MTRGGRSAAGPSPRQGDGPAPARRTAAGGKPATETGGTAGPRPRRGGAGPGAGTGLPRVARYAAGRRAPGQRLTILPIRPRLEDSEPQGHRPSWQVAGGTGLTVPDDLAGWRLRPAR